MREDSLNGTDLPEDELDSRMVRALARKPSTGIDERFAARVLARVPQPTYVATQEPVISRRIGFAAALVLLVVMTVLAPAANERSATTLVLVYGLCAEFLALAVWLGLTPQSRQ